MLYDTLFLYVTTTDEEEARELLEQLIAIYLIMFYNEVRYFSENNAIDMSESELEAFADDYTEYLYEIFTGLRADAEKETERIAEQADELTDETLRNLLQPWVMQRGKVIDDTESVDAIQLAQLIVALTAKEQSPTAKITKEWVALNDERTCPICRALNGKTLPLDEPFLVNGEVVELADGKVFIYNYVDRYVCIAHPNDRCHIQFHIEF